MARSKYQKKIKNGIEYYFYRINDNRLEKPKDLYGKTTKELEEKINKIMKELNNGINIEEGKKNYKEFLRQWLYNIKFINIKNTSKEVYESAYRIHIKEEKILNVKLNELSNITIQNFYMKLKKNKVGTATIKIINIIIKGSIKYAYRNDLIIKDITKNIIIPKPTEKEKLNKKNRINPLTINEQKKLMKKIEGNELELLFLMALFTGARGGELLALTWEDINMNNCTIKISKIAKYQHEIREEGNKKYKTEIQTPKTEKSKRIIPFPKKLKEKIIKHKENQEKIELNLWKKKNKNNLIFCNIKGEYYNIIEVNNKFKSILKSIGIEGHTFHDLRHTYATRLFEMKENPKTVQELLGHSTISTTLNIYTHVLKEVKEEAAEKLNKLYEKIEG